MCLGPWLVLSRHAPPRVDASAWREQARRFLAALVDAGDAARVLTESDTLPVRVASLQTPDVVSRVSVHASALTSASHEKQRADRAVRAIDGAGFDALVSAAKSVWFIEVDPRDDSRAALVVAATLSMVLLGPIVPPGDDAIFGVKTARARLEAAGWA